MPQRKALLGATQKGLDAAQKGVTLMSNPYWLPKAGAYRLAWSSGWILYTMRNSPPVAIECEQCGCESLYPDMVGGLDVWLCRECGYTVPNLELQEIAQTGFDFELKKEDEKLGGIGE